MSAGAALNQFCLRRLAAMGDMGVVDVREVSGAAGGVGSAAAGGGSVFAAGAGVFSTGVRGTCGVGCGLNLMAGVAGPCVL